MNTVPPARTAALGFWMALALVMGSMIGSGVYLLPASLAPFGWNALYGWVFTIAGVLCLAFTLAALARALPKAGGPYGFVLAAFGPLPAFMVGWAYVISIWVANAALTIAAVSYLSVFQPAIAAVTGLPAALAVGLLWAVTLINLKGARVAGGFQIVTMTLKLLPLVAVVVIAAGVLGDGAAAATPYRAADISVGAISACAALTLWAMLGFEAACVPQGKIERAEVVIPRATLAGTLITGVIYLLVSTAVIVLMPADSVAKSNAPFADVIATYWGRGPSLFVALFAAVSAIGALNGWVLMQGEAPLVMARAGSFPKWFGITDARGTPVRGLLLSSLLVSVLILSNYARTMAELFTFMVLLSTAAALVLYLACAAACLRLMATGAMPRTAFLVLIAALGVGYSLWTFSGAGAEASGWVFVLLAVGLPLYAFVRRSVSL